MKNTFANQNVDLDQVKCSWKKTLVQRRTFIRDHSTKEVLQEYPGYCHALLVTIILTIQLIFDEYMILSMVVSL